MTRRWGDVALDVARSNPDVTVVTDVTPMPAEAAQWLAMHPAPLPAAQTIVLPLPPSANRNWKPANGRMYTTAEVKNYKAGVRLMCLQAGLRPYTGEVHVIIHVYRERRSGDGDNYVKVLFDALQGYMFANDNQIVMHQVWRHDDKANPRVEVDVRQVTP